MRYAIVILFVIFSPALTLAQENNLFADIGVPAGLSVTWDHHFTKRISLGAGVQGYNFRPTITNKKEFVPALYGDVRINSIMRKKHFFFYFLDLGMDFYKANDDYEHYDALFDYVPRNDGLYAGLGFGYFRSVTKRHAGPYASMKIIFNWYEDNYYDVDSNKQHVYALPGGAIALSVGFKF